MKKYLLGLLMICSGCTGTSGTQGWQMESSALSYSTIKVKDTPISVMVDTSSDGKMLSYTVTAQSYSLKSYTVDLEIIVSEGTTVVRTTDKTISLPSFKKATVSGTYPQGEAILTIEARVRKLYSADDHGGQ